MKSNINAVWLVLGSLVLGVALGFACGFTSRAAVTFGELGSQLLHDVFRSDQ